MRLIQYIFIRNNWLMWFHFPKMVQFGGLLYQIICPIFLSFFPPLQHICSPVHPSQFPQIIFSWKFGGEHVFGLFCNLYRKRSQMLQKILPDIRSNFEAFLDALASLKTMFKIKSLINVFKISRLQSIREYCRVL